MGQQRRLLSFCKAKRSQAPKALQGIQILIYAFNVSLRGLEM
jgi:hypothetical protein